MNLTGLLREVRSRLDDPENVDRPEDNLWQNDELASYLTEAEHEACRRTGLHKEEIEVTIVPTENTYDLGNRLMYVEKVFYNTVDGKRYQLMPVAEVNLEVTYGLDWRIDKGEPVAYLVDDYDLVLFREPVQAGTLDVEATTVPDTAFDAASDTDAQTPVSALPVRYHLALVDYACGLAYLKNDEQTYDPNASQKHMKRFDMLFGQQLSVGQERFKRSQMPTRMPYPRL